MADLAASTTGFAVDFIGHTLGGVKMVGLFFLEFFQTAWSIVWSGGLPLFVLFVVIMIFFAFGVLKYTFHNLKHLALVIGALLVIAMLTALGLLL